MSKSQTPRMYKLSNRVRSGRSTSLLTLQPVHFHQEISPAPGQFLMLSIPGVGEAAFTYATLPDKHGCFQILVRSIGHLTETLLSLPPDSLVGVRGPFGQGWPITRMHGHSVLFIAGGCGLATMSALLNHAEHYQIHPELIYGAREPEYRQLGAEMDQWHTQFQVTECYDSLPDDAPGEQGNPVDILQDKLSREPSKAQYALLCGPEVLMEKAAQVLMRHNFPPDHIFLSLERRMHCGVGTCGHCYLGTRYVCTDGPVFSWQELASINTLTANAPAPFHPCY